MRLTTLAPLCICCACSSSPQLAADAGRSPDAGSNDAADAPDSDASGPTACADGPVLQPCRCGGATVVGDYCCGGAAQIGPCADYGGGGSTYYIDPMGDDAAGDGSSAKPWRSLAHACSKVSSAGDVIHIDAGTYLETVPCKLGVGVSIEGVGPSSVITSNIATTYVETIDLSSPKEGTVGNQHVSGFELDGLAQTADSPIAVVGRSNVSLHDLTISNFQRQGPRFAGSVSGVAPTIYATGNMFYRNTVTNCASDYYSNNGGTTYHFADGGLLLGGQDGMLIHHDVIDETKRFGYPIKYTDEGHNKGCRIYANTITANFYDGQPNSWNMSIELWYSEGGIEIFDNNIVGPIDLAGAYTKRGSYAFAVDIHHNVMGPAALQSHLENGIYIERAQEGPVYIRDNVFHNIGMDIAIYPDVSDTLNDIFIYGNVFDTMGVVGTQWAGGGISMSNIENAVGTQVHGFHVADNVFNAGAGGTPSVAIALPTLGQASDVTIQNNIVQGFAYAAVYGGKPAVGDVTIDGLSIENNIFWNNANNDPIFKDFTPTNLVIQQNINADPLFAAPTDFHLHVGSPGIGAGLAIPFVTQDPEGVPVGNPPNIGCYQTVH